VGSGTFPAMPTVLPTMMPRPVVAVPVPRTPVPRQHYQVAPLAAQVAAPKAAMVPPPQDLQQLRMDFEDERRRSEDLAGRVREQLCVLDAELRDSSSAREELESVKQLQLCAQEELTVGRAEAMAAATSAAGFGESADGRRVANAGRPASGDPLDGDRDSKAEVAMQLAATLQHSVRGLMAQGLEFHKLMVQREADLQARLQASEAARLEAEARVVAQQDDCLAGAEHDVREAVVRRLEAQVKELEMQVEFLGSELADARLAAQRDLPMSERFGTADFRRGGRASTLPAEQDNSPSSHERAVGTTLLQECLGARAG